MGFLTKLVDSIFGRLQSGFADEYKRQAEKAGVHPIVAKSIHERAIREFKLDEIYYSKYLEIYKNDLKKLNEIKNNRHQYLVEHWGSEENYELFKQKIEKEISKKGMVNNANLEEYNKSVQKNKQKILKKHNKG